ncbi:cobalamin biosynthesis protein [Streptomyces sp. NPDC052396]|uniref:cobalamin biosynthesis protein n=1 Tax=Streptomyces sp. NPDC052396 TaxID=3365689 RepID=UPI0037CED3C9
MKPAPTSNAPAAALTLGVGARRGVTPDEVLGLIGEALAAAGPGVVAVLATVDAKAAEPGILAAAERLGLPVRAYPAVELAGQGVPNPSAAVRDTAGTGSVAEAAALLAAGPGGVLVVPKRKAPRVTVAIARNGTV